MTSFDNTTPLTGFKALSFDCYGTLIEWEPGLLSALDPIITRLAAEHPYAKDPGLALQRFDVLSNELEHTQPTLKYDLNLVTAMKKLAAEVGVGEGEGEGEREREDRDKDRLTAADLQTMATGPGTWPAFPDTMDALRTLKRHYKLIILSNIDNANIARTISGPLGGGDGEGLFDAVYTAEDIGSYKPCAANFEYLFRRAREELGVDVDKGELLHVARSLTVDHSAAKAMGIRSCWIARGGDKKQGQGIGGDYERMVREGKASFQWKFDTLGDFAREVARQFGDE